ncbi:uncharacterized protein LOC111052368 [Nilaparvata lugens]|uniref:uncharacterized protein LOC111052368 n=1 Tax=Nilaparvata lugens TaxID=108931 RepID=UPI000B98438A|nr:uncharacterized protein LOC111052368 [Nilaparvata lugens]
MDEISDLESTYDLFSDVGDSDDFILPTSDESSDDDIFELRKRKKSFKSKKKKQACLQVKQFTCNATTNSSKSAAEVESNNRKQIESKMKNKFLRKRTTMLIFPTPQIKTGSMKISLFIHRRKM